MWGASAGKMAQTENKKTENPTSVDRSPCRSRPRAREHLWYKGGCVRYNRELLGPWEWLGNSAMCDCFFIKS